MHYRSEEPCANERYIELPMHSPVLLWIPGYADKTQCIPTHHPHTHTHTHTHLHSRPHTHTHVHSQTHTIPQHHSRTHTHTRDTETDTLGPVQAGMCMGA